MRGESGPRRGELEVKANTEWKEEGKRKLGG